MLSLILGVIIGGAIGYALGAHITASKFATLMKEDLAYVVATIKGATGRARK